MAQGTYEASNDSEPFSAEKYFATQPPPPTLEEDVARVRDFVRRQQAAKRKVVLVTVRPLYHLILAVRLQLRVVDMFLPGLFDRVEGQRSRWS